MKHTKALGKKIKLEVVYDDSQNCRVFHNEKFFIGKKFAYCTILT